MKEIELLEQKEIRESFIGRTEVLDRVGGLLILPNTEHATTEQVAQYYNVDVSVIKMQLSSNREEIMADGVKNLSGIETKEFLVSKNILPTNFRGYFEAEGQRFANRNNILFPKRAILRIGMLLRDSEVAKEIRTRLLDIVQDTEKISPEIVHNVVNEISEERQLILDKAEAEYQGDYDTVSIVNAKLFALKNKRIKELEDTNKSITTNALTIIESRDVINRVVRNIAMKEYNGIFGKAFGELYSKINYKLGINIKARDKKKNDSYLSTLTEEETFKVELIVRSWAIAVGLDLDKLLKIA